MTAKVQAGAVSETVSSKLSCSHCGLPVPAFRALGKSAQDVLFCCDGCKAVYHIIQSNGLQDYYQIRANVGFSSFGKPASSVFSRYAYLDEASVREKLAYGQDSRCMDFYVEGAHCAACLWLIERIGKIVPGVKSVRMNLGELTAKVSLTPEGRFSDVAEGFERIGYRPHPVSEADQAVQLSRAENRRDLMRIGVAGFCMMNIMILFISIYAGAKEELLALFRWISGGLFLPVAFYAAWPFYRGAYSAVKNRHINIDLPVAGAVFMGSAASLRNLLIGAEHVYFDSLAAFVFLLLSARYALKVLHQKSASGVASGEFLIPKSALLYDVSSEKKETVPAAKLTPGSLIFVPEGEIFAVDGEVFEGKGFADFHMITGESEPVQVQPGSPIYAGVVNTGPALIVRVSASGKQTRIEQLLGAAAEMEPPRAVQFADAAAKVYLGAVLLGAFVLVGFGFQSSFSAAFDRALSMIIIACPCALALSTPLVYQMASRVCLRFRVLLKSSAALEKMAEAKSVLIDKTGTLTYGRYEVLAWKALEGEELFEDVAYALEKKSAHPIALAIRNFVSQKKEISGLELVLDQYGETLGKGVWGKINGHHYEMKGIAVEKLDGRENLSVKTAVGVFEDGKLKVQIQFGDKLREGALIAVTRLQKLFKKICILSGDRSEAVENVARQLHIDCYWGGVSPEEKREKTAAEIRPLMVGDGANDAAAMKAAHVSVAVQGSIETSFQCADVYLTVPGLDSLPEIISIARRAKKTVWTALAASLCYNFFGMALAVFGWVTPLIAAVAMPISSFSVLAIAYIGIEWRKSLQWK